MTNIELWLYLQSEKDSGSNIVEAVASAGNDNGINTTVTVEEVE